MINKSHSKSATHLNFSEGPPKYLDPLRSCKERKVKLGLLGPLEICCSRVIVDLFFKDEVSEINA